MEARRDELLARHTTLELGGPARRFVEVTTRAEIVEALRQARREALPVAILAGGSNVVVADEGFEGLVIRLATRGTRILRQGGRILAQVEAGEPWDRFVATTVDEGWAGLECLSGIPGTVGATPIQNVGAYGQEVGERIIEVELLDRETLAVESWSGDRCAFGYRTSRFRRNPERYVVLAVTFVLSAGGEPAVRYGELARALDVGNAPPTLAATREAVLALRRSKSMVLDPRDPNRRSVGSFFLNPVLSPSEVDSMVARAVASGAVGAPDEVPRHAAPAGFKVPAAWLVERAGFARGTRRGGCGISSRHALALVHHGGGSTAELVALALAIRAGVAERFGVVLHPEPVFLGPVTWPGE